MGTIEFVDDHGLEVLKKAGTIPDDNFKTRYALRVTGENFSGSFTPSGLSIDQKNTVMDVTNVATAMPLVALTDRNSISIRNLDLVKTLYIGKANVTADTINGNTSGWQVGPNETYNVDLTDAIIIYGVVEAGSIKVQVRELA